MSDEKNKERKYEPRSTNRGLSIRRRNRIRQAREDRKNSPRRLTITKAEKIHCKCMVCGRAFRKGKPSDAEMCRPCLKFFRKQRGR